MKSWARGDARTSPWGFLTVKREDAAEGELFDLCPIHGERPDTNSLSFSYNYKTDKYHCFSCGAGGDLASLWQETQGRPGKEGFKDFCVAYHIDQEGKSSPKPAGRGNSLGLGGGQKRCAHHRSL